jgi:Xaa-Pro dipeptidase
MQFDNSEFQDRVSRTRAQMEKNDLDLLLLFGQEAVCWLSGFYTPAYFAYTALGLPAKGEPFLVLRGMEEAAAKVTCWVENRFPYRDDESPIAYVREAVKTRGLESARIGIDKHSWYLTVERYEELSSAFPSAVFLAENRMIEKLRIRKSPAELAYLRQAGRIVGAAIQAAFDATSPGVSERQIAAAMAAARISAGSDLPIDGVLTTGERTAQGHGPWTDRIVRKGDLLSYEFHGIKNHYWARMLRSGVLGEPTTEQQRTADIVIAAQDNALRHMRAGVHVRVIDDLCRAPLIEAGLKQRESYVNRVGYGLGLNFRPTPGDFLFQFTPDADFVLEAGMVFHMIASANGLGISDTVAVTADGVEFITTLPRKLVVCPC